MATVLHRFRGCLALTGPVVDELAHSAIAYCTSTPASTTFDGGPSFHITVLTKEELRRQDERSEHSKENIQADASRIYSAGIGGNKGVYFVVIIWAAGQQLRKRLGLPPKDFHITLTRTDNHEMDKSIHSLLHGQPPQSPSSDFLDHLTYTLHITADHQTERQYCIQLIHTMPDSHRGFLRLGDVSLSLSLHKLAMLSYCRAFPLATSQNVKDYCVKKSIECSHYTEWGCLFMDSEREQLPAEITALLLRPWSGELRELLSEANITPTLPVASRQPMYVSSGQRLPRFFRWLIPFYFAIMSTPRTEQDITLLASIGIKHVLTLTEEEPLPQSWFAGTAISNTFLPVSNYCPPSIEQMDIIMRLFDDPEKVLLLVHCGGGKGRAGTVAACYLVAYGFGKPHPNQDHPEITAHDAIATLRSLRPGSIETSQQEAFVSKWCSTIWKRQAVLPDLPSEPPPSPLEVEGVLDCDADLFVLVGLPGAGKSWFAQALVKRDPKVWTRISQDDSGSRASCEALIGRKPYTRRTLLDRCNTSSAERRSWLSSASNWVKAPICVWFDYDRELCVSRAQRRTGHPTLPPGHRVQIAVHQMNKQFERPSVREGFKAVVIIRSFNACQELVARLSPSIGIFKFPRTPHLIDLGAATPDDLITDTSAIPGHVVITEKVDGANMGFSLSSDRERIVVQNRSHYVDSSTHEQFRKLGHWVDLHREALIRVLGRDEHFPERYVLYGEWMYATHSIPYTNLPDRFLAFDLYDRYLELFVDRQSLNALLCTTSIQVVPLIYEGKMPSEGDLKKLVPGRSRFWDGRVEGVYVKVERDGRVVSRGKVVRADFISGNEHWTKGNLRLNGLSVDARDDYWH
ncbi:ATP dependent DNA ligase [Desarmillaria tabescens]|uniref:ATP dependent DNA ligase n=1 Tax=Armillaria tabescens TaxID=1929756 RepID=A0AA39TQI9_ARMTA|nr:ATP dependent DNA ligase [Desarmillaria tabescens]KAK0467007.1 ATP dependent DNA ligase [Desarmillaria tabescens]